MTPPARADSITVTVTAPSACRPGSSPVKLKLAQSILSHALTEARARRLPPLSVVILDERSQIKLSVTEDGASAFRQKIAFAKANGALGMGMSTGQLFDLFERGVLPDRFAMSIMFAADGGFAPQPGGELIVWEGEVAGAIGISGASSDEDEVVARTALALSLK